MKHTKKIVFLLLIAVMILSSLGALYAETTIIKFTDISSSWARQHIINVNNKGLMSGVSESLFKPLSNISHFEVFVSITRMTNAKQKYDLAALEAKYKISVLDKYSVPVYARQATAYCLEEGIITVNDISGLKANTLATKQVISAYIGKVFGVTFDPTKPIVVLKYDDSMFINKENKVYIIYLIGIGVLDSNGVNGYFNPDELIARGTYAKMLDIASDKYNALFPPIPVIPTVPTIPIVPPIQSDYVGTVEEVTIEYGAITFLVKDANNLMLKKNFSVADDITCTIDGVENSNYWKIKSGDNALIYLNKEGKISKLIIDSKVLSIPGAGGSLITTDRGIIESITYTRTSAPKITMMSLDGKMKEYFIKKDLTTINILIFDEEHYVYDLKPSMNISIELENEEIIKLTIN